jgi:hypothetical protein
VPGFDAVSRIRIRTHGTSLTWFMQYSCYATHRPWRDTDSLRVAQSTVTPDRRKRSLRPGQRIRDGRAFLLARTVLCGTRTADMHVIAGIFARPMIMADVGICACRRLPSALSSRIRHHCPADAVHENSRATPSSTQSAHASRQDTEGKCSDAFFRARAAIASTP